MKTSKLVRSYAISAALAGALILTGCNDDAGSAQFNTPGGEDPSATVATQADPQQEPGESEPATTDGTGEPGAVVSGGAEVGSSAVVDAPNFDSVVMEGTFEVSQKPGNFVRIGVNEIVVTGPVMHLQLVLEKTEGNDYIHLMWATDQGSASDAVSLLDRENLKRYEVLENANSSKLATAWNTNLELNVPIYYDLYFAAPQDDIDMVDVMFAGGLPNFQNVPIKYAD